MPSWPLLCSSIYTGFCLFIIMYLYLRIKFYYVFFFLVALAKFMLFFKYVNLVALGLNYVSLINQYLFSISSLVYHSEMTSW